MKKTLTKFVAIAGLAATAVMPAKADLTFGLDYIFSGTTAPGLPGPWATATLSDVAGGVQLTMSGSGLSGTEFLGSWYFNLKSSLDATSLNIAQQSSSGVTVDSVSTGADAFKADGDGFFDILFDFAQSGAGRFEAGDSVTYLITGIPGLTAADFNYASETGGGQGVYFSAAHLQSLSNGQSDWIGDGDGGGRDTGGPVPEPSTYLVLGSFVGLAVYLKRRIASVAQFSVAKA
ncbi:MAG: hypothetical protein EXS35_03025 [Pedosphaera sp.]|nr:hypothetical protein [Pedosphaera sp.]